MGAEAQDISKSTGRKLIEEGRRKGHAEGHAEGRQEVASRLLAKGTPPAEVAELTELPLEEILRLTH